MDFREFFVLGTWVNKDEKERPRHKSLGPLMCEEGKGLQGIPLDDLRERP
jgi:hypothetical protein